MKALLIAVVLMLMIVSPIMAQTTVNLSVTDTPDNQTWNNGTWSVKLIPSSGNLSQTGTFSFTGGGSIASQSGTLSGTGTASMSLPATANIAPTSQWQFTVCPQPSNNTNCFQQSVTVSTTSPQTLALTPPSIRINLAVATPPVSAYATGEISGAVIGSQFYLLGTGMQVCSVISGNICTTWSAVGSLSPLVGPLTFSATAFGVKADAVYVLDATWTNNQNTVSCTNNDCNFTAADNNKLCWGINTVSGTATMPVGTLTVTGAQSATCSTATGSIAATGTFAWCTDDTASWINLRNAYYASQRAAFIEGPGGHTCVTKAPLRDTRANVANAAMWAPSFQSPSGMTIFIPTPTFDFTTCNNPIAGMNGGCFWDTAPTGATSQQNLPQYGKVQNFGVNGLGFNALPAAANGLFAAAFQRVEGSNIWLWNWGANAGTFSCADAIAPNSFYNLNINSCGANGLITGGGFSNGITWLVTSYIGGGGMATLLAVAGTGSITVSKGSYYLTGCLTQCIIVNAGNQLTMDGDEINGGSGNQYFDVAGTLFLINGVKQVATNNNGHAILTRATGKVFVRDSSISETGTSGIAFNVNLVPGGTIVNEGNNTLVGTDQTALVSSMIVLSAGWGTTATTTALTGSPSSNPTRFSFQVNSSGTGQAANPTMAFTYPNVGSTPTWTCKQVGGTGTLTTISGEGTATSTTMTLTFNGTPVATSNYIITCTGALQ